MKLLMQMDGAEILATEEPFVLISWKPNAMDRAVQNRSKLKRPNPYLGEYRKGSSIAGVPPREKKIPAKMGSFPVINLKQWTIE